MISPIPFWLKQRAYLTPDRTAVITGEEQLSFRRLEERSRQWTTYLAACGVARGSHVALLMPNHVQTIELMHALSYMGAVLVPLNIRLTAAELAFQLNDVDAALLIYAEEFAEKMASLKSQISCPCLSVKELEALTPVQSLKLTEQIVLDQVHSIIYTSGTTGRPKGTMLTYGNHWWSAIGSALNLGLEANDRWLCCLPLFHVSGLSILMRSLIYGMPVVLHERFIPKQVNESIAKHKVTHISVVSTMLKEMLEALPAHKGYPDHLRCVLLGGGPAPKPLLDECLRRSVPVYQTYGLTETASQIVTLSPDHLLQKVGSAGKPLFPAEMRILKNGNEVKAGEVGEIVVRGPNVTKGYYKREEANKKSIQDGWLFTGDLGYVDQEGFLYVLDRQQDLIISGGENVYPAEVEAVLLAHPAIKEAGVTGRPDPKWGAVPVAFLVIKKGYQLNKGELYQYCAERLASYKIPKQFYFVPSLPRNASNKLMRRKLSLLLDQSSSLSGSPT